MLECGERGNQKDEIDGTSQKLNLLMFQRTKDNRVHKHWEIETVGLRQLAEFSLKYGHQENEEGQMESSSLAMLDLRGL